MAIDARPYPIDPGLFGKVAVLMGGWSAEREISLKSGAAVLDALRHQGVNAVGVDVQRPQVVAALSAGGFDRAFNILHGPGGEDGVIQGLLETLQIPYTGSGVLASALAMDKLRCKELLEGSGIPTPPWMVLEADTAPGLVEATLGLPVMVKPALEGSSIGMSKVSEADDLPAAYKAAAAYAGEVLAERWIGGREYTVAVLGEEALPVIALETPREFYDYAAKYEADDTRYLCPCGLAAEEEQRLQRLALAAFEAVGASGWGRVDILADTDGTPYVIELNTVPGMTDHSLVPMAAKAAGIGFDELVVRILA
ncbi:MAG TPA: D-alanine--D-alanine ligase, partial [Rhodospirillales bacterium]|nr:D-alanine--D-alanine ligase [Rhodospirillales bacterium]